MFEYEFNFYSVFFEIYYKYLYELIDIHNEDLYNLNASVAFAMNEYFIDTPYENMRGDLYESYGFSYLNEICVQDDNYINRMFIENTELFEDYIMNYKIHYIINKYELKFIAKKLI